MDGGADLALSGFVDQARQAALGGASSSSLPKAGTSRAALEKAAQDFEAMFMTQMLQPMWEGLEVDETFGGGHGEEVMRGFLLQEYGKAMASGARSGLSDSVRHELLRAQEAAQTGNALSRRPS